MDDIRNMLLGVDTSREIFTLWYEITFLRNCVNAILAQNPTLFANLREGTIEECRENAQKEVQERFPVCKIDFSQPTEEMLQKQKEHVEALRKFNTVMGGLVGKPNDNPPDSDLTEIKGET